MKLDVPVIGILRGVAPDFFGQLMMSAFAAGLQAMEVTFNTLSAIEMVRTHRTRVPAGKWLGMGTIRNLEEARKAVAAGAMFLVTPNVDPSVIRYAVSHGVPVIAGGLTPTEVYAAWSAGATMVKVFPCGGPHGPRYISDLRGPYDQIPLVAVGGITAENVNSYFEAGAAAVGVGATLFGKQALADHSPDAAGEHVRRFLKILSS
ncbi:MAG: bifunctional 4-hydroxy-2-oxoglutarate aldolase/2-dehydro-3-deoxy-phosphogluconate aldolase [Desulfatitalea sp.]|nr:bifunctional 4-hydroxy-2-oxoglutarate aldolase/2-dehydro-3-deoxy-phosphogluconate aldolase [Desulfatitalea sp.]NNK02862.1 bifunctional 4-hydroxy-2-oxoglutarate aldolase/2-dehydro-3-deoxy-phosphogluconate aldolase [Desulfatitalea sp.]